MTTTSTRFFAWLTLGLCAAACGGTLDFGDAPSGGTPADTSVDRSDPFSPGDVDPNATLEPGWTWLNPRPHGNDHRGIGGTGPNDIWLGDDAGGIWHVDGTRIEKSHQGTADTPYYAIWANAKDDVWAVGRGDVEHFDGTRWSNAFHLKSRAVHALWGTPTGDLFAACENGQIVHYQRGRWIGMETLYQDGTPGPARLHVRDIWGSSAQDVWAVGDHGAFAHFDGIEWKTAPESGDDPRFPQGAGDGGPQWVDNDYVGIWGSGSNDIWALAHDDTAGVDRFAHFDGTTWSIEQEVERRWGGSPSSTQPTERGKRVWGAAANDILAISGPKSVYHFDGRSWELRRTFDRLWEASLWGTSASGLLAAGKSGDLVRHEPGVRDSAWAKDHPDDMSGPWTPVFPAVRDTFAQVLAGTDGAVFAQGRQTYRWRDTQWEPVQHDLPADCAGGKAQGGLLAGTSAHDLWVARALQCPSQPEPRVRLEHFDGTRWRETSGDGFEHVPYVLFAPAPNEVWSGAYNYVRHYASGKWTTHLLAGDQIVAINARSPNDVWFLSIDVPEQEHITVSHWDGRTLRTQHQTTMRAQPTRSMNVSPTGEVWIGGQPGLLFDGTRWRELPAGTDYQVRAIASSGSTTYLVAGTRVLSYDGSSTRDLGIATQKALRASAVTRDGAIWFVGESGATLRYVPEKASGPPTR